MGVNFVGAFSTPLKTCHMFGPYNLNWQDLMLHVECALDGILQLVVQIRKPGYTVANLMIPHQDSNLLFQLPSLLDEGIMVVTAQRSIHRKNRWMLGIPKALIIVHWAPKKRERQGNSEICHSTMEDCSTWVVEITGQIIQAQPSHPQSEVGISGYLRA